MSNSTVVRIPKGAADFFLSESERQNRRFRSVVAGAANAFRQLSPAQREEFTIGEPMTIATAASLLGRTGPAKPNRKRGAK